MAIWHMVHDLTDGPAAVAIRSIELLCIQSGHGLAHPGGQCGNLVNVPMAGFRAGRCVWGKTASGIAAIGHRHNLAWKWGISFRKMLLEKVILSKLYADK